MRIENTKKNRIWELICTADQTIICSIKSKSNTTAQFMNSRSFNEIS